MFAAMDRDTGASAVPTAQNTAGAPAVLLLKELGKTPRGWTLTLHPEHLALAEASSAQPYVILREEMMKSVTLIEGMNTLGLTKPLKVTFKLAPEATATLAGWIGKPVLASHYLRRRYAWVLPVAIIWMLGALPLPGSPAAGIEATRFDVFGFGLGLTLLVAWAFAKWKPHPALFLVDSLWFTWLAVYLVVGVFNGRSKAWFLLVALLVWMVLTGLKHYARFRGTSLPRVGA